MEPLVKDITKLKASLLQKRKTQVVGIERKKKSKSIGLGQLPACDGHAFEFPERVFTSTPRRTVRARSTLSRALASKPRSK